MKKLFIKSILILVLIALVLEILIRILHLTKDYPTRYVDQFNVEKWKPKQEGYSVTGIRKQNYSKYRINDSGYNSYREFLPSNKKIELALVGDSFIEGFHQNYNNSIGSKIEDKVDNIEVYEFGYAGYDLADQLHLIHQYKYKFDLIDFVLIGLSFENDLERSKYYIVEYRMRLESPFYKTLRKSKLLVYLQNIGILDSPRILISKFFNNSKSKNQNTDKSINRNLVENKIINFQKNIQNFNSLVKNYGFDKSRFIFFLDLEKTPQKFIKYLHENDFKFIDFSQALKKSKKPTTLIYDMHWNDHGRDLVAQLISDWLKNNNPNLN